MREAAQAALTKVRLRVCGPRGFYGSIDVHEQLEARVASFSNTKQAIAFSDAASCCTSTVAAFAKRGDLLVVDDGISEPLRTGCVLSRARVVAYKHNDAQDLKRVMEGIRQADRRKGRAPTAQRRFVVCCEAVSRDHGGDVAPLKEILQLKDEFGYRLILDESLSWGVLGATGRGLKEACGIEDPTSVEITCVDLAPALGSNGGLCIGTDEVVAHQRLSGAGYCFSAAAPPFYSAAALAALDILDSSEGQKTTRKITTERVIIKEGAGQGLRRRCLTECRRYKRRGRPGGGLRRALRFAARRVITKARRHHRRGLRQWLRRVPRDAAGRRRGAGAASPQKEAARAARHDDGRPQRGGREGARGGAGEGVGEGERLTFYYFRLLLGSS